MNALFKLNSKTPSFSILDACFRSNLIKRSILFDNNNNSLVSIEPSIRNNYTFTLGKSPVKYRRATRPKKTKDNSVPLSYEQSQFAEKLGVTKSWNTWNTSNLLDGKRQAENARDDIIIRKFLAGTFHDLYASEIIIKRRMNTINIGFLIKIPRREFISKVYFLVGYSEELLSCLLKCVVKIQPQSIFNKNDLIFKNW